MSALYAKVIVDISHANVDRLFDYRIPDGMELKTGMRVAVPFGRQTLEGALRFMGERYV